MNCSKARSLLMPWLDSELDARSTLELQEHLRDCKACARRFEAEARIEAGLVERLQDEALPDAVWQACLRGLDTRSVRTRRWPALAAAAGLLLAVAGGWWAWTLSRSAPVDIFEHCRAAYAEELGGRAEPDLPSSEAPVLQAWLDGRGLSAFRVPEPGHHFGHLLSLVGVRAESFEGVDAVALLINCCGHPATVFIMDAGDADHLPAQVAAQLHDGGMAQVTVDGVTTKAFIDHDLLVSIVSEHEVPAETWRSS